MSRSIANRVRRLIVVLLLYTICCPGQILAQVTIPADSVKRIELQRKAEAAIEVKPDSLAAHQLYIKLIGISNPLLQSRYQAWIDLYPQNIVIPSVIGAAYYNAEMPQARNFLLKAVALDSKNANLWFMLCADAERWGQQDLSAEYMRKAALADSSDAGYAFYYLMTFENSDAKLYKQKVFDFVKKFPESSRGAQALYWLAVKANNINDRINYFEELRRLYPPKSFNWSAAGMAGLADAYLQTDTEKALSLINEMGGEPDWQLRKRVAESLMKISQLEQIRNYKGALAQLDQLKLPKFNYIEDFIAIRKSSIQSKAGYRKLAYDSLAVKFAIQPTDQLYTELEAVAKRIGQDREHVLKDIQDIRNSKAVAAYSFDLGLYTGSNKLKLKDLKGKVILLTFWFPGCGPCRGEFPHIQEVINKFHADDIVYLGINVMPTQDPYVLPFIKNTKYSFIPLRGTADFAKKYFGVSGEPENFLIDRNGKIIFKNFRIDNSNHRTLELMLSSLLSEK